MTKWLLALFAGFAINAQSAGLQFIYVNGSAPPGGNGTPDKPFNTIGDAVTYARTAGGHPTVQVAPGLYQISNTITIDFPMDLVGSDVLEIDSNGWPTGVVGSGTQTEILGVTALGASPLVLAGNTDGPVIENVNIRGFTFVGGPGGGDDITIAQVQNFSVTGNIVTGPSPVITGNGIGPVASSGLIAGNYIAGVVCGGCIRAGNSASPAYVVFTGNRSVQNQGAGVLLGGASCVIVPPTP
jgi:hypothetical protein